VKKTAVTIALTFTLVLLVNFRIFSFDEAVCNGTLIVTVNSPQDKVYTSHNVPISISANDPAKLTGPESVAYSLDGGPPVIIATAPLGMHSLNGSSVLSLSNGRHKIVGIGITWFNGTTDGIFFSKPIYFTVDSPVDYVPTPSPTASPSPSPEPTSTSKPTPTPTPTAEPQQPGQDMTAGAIFAVTSIIIFLGLLVYFIKRK